MHINNGTNILKCYLCTNKQKIANILSDMIGQLPSETKCFMCSYETDHSQGLHKHLISHLSQSDNLDEKKMYRNKMYRCLVCQQISFGLENLRTHVFTHIDGTSLIIYKCNKCEYVTNWQYMLSRHESTHQTVEKLEVIDEHDLRKYIFILIVTFFKIMQ